MNQKFAQISSEINKNRQLHTASRIKKIPIALPVRKYNLTQNITADT